MRIRYDQNFFCTVNLCISSSCKNGKRPFKFCLVPYRLSLLRGQPQKSFCGSFDFLVVDFFGSIQLSKDPLYYYFIARCNITKKFYLVSQCFFNINLKIGVLKPLKKSFHIWKTVFFILTKNSYFIYVEITNFTDVFLLKNRWALQILNKFILPIYSQEYSFRNIRRLHSKLMKPESQIKPGVQFSRTQPWMSGIYEIKTGG